MFVVSILINKNKSPLTMYLPTFPRKEIFLFIYPVQSMQTFGIGKIDKAFGYKCTYVFVWAKLNVAAYFCIKAVLYLAMDVCKKTLALKKCQGLELLSRMVYTFTLRFEMKMYETAWKLLMAAAGQWINCGTILIHTFEKWSKQLFPKIK